MTPNFELYQTHFALAKKYASQENFQLAYFAMLEAATALLDDCAGHLQGVITVIDQINGNPKDPAI